MSRTTKHQKQRSLKDQIQQRKVELHETGLNFMFDDVAQGLNSEFYRGATRYGNKRHYESYMKWKRRKADRYEGRKELNEGYSKNIANKEEENGN